MNSFLHRVANTYFQEHRENMTAYTFVFPNRRAGIFFQYALSQCAGKSIFSPDILTIEDCFKSFTDIQPADRTDLIFKIYLIYKKHSRSDESFDSFVYWGEIILNDFNEIDKYLVDAQQLFQNIADLKDIDGIFSYFSDAQLEAIKMFWTHFNPGNNQPSQLSFLETWKILYPIYQEIRELLFSENSAYEGMLYRSVIESIRNIEIKEKYPEKQFVFIGFNALNPVERELFKILLKNGIADFYWDYEAEELRDPDNPASMFYLKNIKHFPSRYAIIPHIESLKEKHFELISIPSAVGQSKQIYKILNQIFPPKTENYALMSTAVVLPDENFLIPVLQSIPEQISKINVTMGFPLQTTPVAGLMDLLFVMYRKAKRDKNQVRYYHQHVLSILNHQLIAQQHDPTVKMIIDEMTNKNLIYVSSSHFSSHPFLAILFQPVFTVDELLNQLKKIIRAVHNMLINSEIHADAVKMESSFLYQYLTVLNRLSDIYQKYENILNMNPETMMLLINQLTASISVPFVGEPLEGMQIMGVLETRGLDFDNLIICSFNEGVYPQKNNANSFIPYHLRKGFQLPTFEHQDAVASYNFYRLIHHAKNIIMLTDSRTDAGSSGEVSRFFYQLHYYHGIDIHQKTPVYDMALNRENEITIKKDFEILNKLEQFKKGTNQGFRTLSASSLNSYISCPLQFYFNYIENISEEEEIAETIEYDMFGNLFHAVMDDLYNSFTGKLINKEIIEEIIKHPLKIDQSIVQAFNKLYFKSESTSKHELEGNNLLIAKILRKYIIKVLEIDIDYTPFTLIRTEEKKYATLPTRFGEIQFKGIIDRVDEKEGKIRIIDYKTGGGSLDFNNWDAIFESGNSKRPKHILQTFLYSYLYEKDSHGKQIQPGLFYIKNAFKSNFSTGLIFKEDGNKTEIQDYREQSNAFIERLTKLTDDIFNPDIPFHQTDNADICKYCNYSVICKK